MRSRRRPALQDKTPGNTPQSRHSNASNTKETLFSVPRKPLEALPIAPEAVPVISDENGAPISVPPSPKPHHVRRVPQPPPEPLDIGDTGSEISAPPSPTPARIRRPGGRAADAHRYSDIRSDAARRSDVLSAAMLPVREEREPLAYGASDDSSAAPSPSPVKTMKWPVSTSRPLAPPKFKPLIEHATSSIPAKYMRMSSSSRQSGSFHSSTGPTLPPPPPPFFEQRTPSFVPPTPRPKHVQTLLRPANDEEGVLASPTPVKTGLGPLLAQSTPLQIRRRRPRLPLNKLPSRTTDAVATTSKAKGKQRAREESLPPSSPPPPSPSGPHVPFGVRADLMAELDDEPLEPDDKENTAAPPGPLQKQRSRSSEDDPFGFLAAERKLKMLRREKGQDGTQPRRPLGTLTVSRRTPSPGPSAAPLQLPTPDGDSDADEDPGDDRFLGIGSPGLAREAQAEELPDPPPSDPVVQPVQDDQSDALSYADPEDVAMDTGDLEEGDKENAAPDAPPGPGESIPASPQVVPPRTPHKPKSARKRSPLPTPHFECESSEVGEDTPSRSMGPIEELELPSPRLIGAPLQSSAARDDDAVEDALSVEPVQDSDDADEKEDTPKPSAPVTRKRRREQAGDEDPEKAAKKLEGLLPKRPVKRAKRGSDDESEAEEPLAKRTRGRGRGRGRGATRGVAGRARGRGKGKARADVVDEVESGTESDAEEEEEETKPKPSSNRGRATRGRGAPSSRGSSRGRSRGTSSRPPSSSARVTRSRSQKPPSKSKPDSKGKKRARDEDEEIDIEEDEERARSRQARIEYFRKLEEYSLEKEDVYVI